VPQSETGDNFSVSRERDRERDTHNKALSQSELSRSEIGDNSSIVTKRTRDTTTHNEELSQSKLSQ